MFKADFYRMTGKRWSILYGLFTLMTSRNIRYMFYFRLLNNSKMKIIYPIINLLRIILSRKTGIEIRPETKIGKGFRMVHPYNITINEHAVLGENINLFKGCTIGYSLGKKAGFPVIGNNVQIGINATVLGGVHIGDDVLIAPNAFVNEDVPSHSVVVGNPCRVIHKENATGEYVYFLV